MIKRVYFCSGFIEIEGTKNPAWFFSGTVNDESLFERSDTVFRNLKAHVANIADVEKSRIQFTSFYRV